MRQGCGVFNIRSKPFNISFFRNYCPILLCLTFFIVIINLNADCLLYICIAILQYNLKHYIMIRTIFEFETNPNAVLLFYPVVRSEYNKNVSLFFDN